MRAEQQMKLILFVLVALADARLLEQHAFCEKHGLKANLHRKPAIYDAFLFNHEADMLEIRLHETARYVDYFVITEAAVSTTGHPKRMMFQDIQDRYALFKDQIIYNPLNDAGEGEISWDREKYIRNQLFAKIEGLRTGDILLVSDADELIRPDILRALKECTGYKKTLQFNMQLYYYAFSWRHPAASGWDKVHGIVYDETSSLAMPDEIRYQRAETMFPNAGWHCSNCFSSIEQMRNKILNYGHTELFQQRFLAKSWIVESFRTGRDIFDRNSEVYVFGDADDVPAYVRSQPNRFGYLLDRRGPTAGFQDFLD
jgi:beta-1,4-mannosyl-glycoprotein beta-1,4-N-acetylglucosaminyltransferase